MRHAADSLLQPTLLIVLIHSVLELHVKVHSKFWNIHKLNDWEAISSGDQHVASD